VPFFDAGLFYGKVCRLGPQSDLREDRFRSGLEVDLVAVEPRSPPVLFGFPLEPLDDLSIVLIVTVVLGVLIGDVGLEAYPFPAGLIVLNLARSHLQVQIVSMGRVFLHLRSVVRLPDE
jgi:hypothetical protein